MNIAIQRHHHISAWHGLTELVNETNTKLPSKIEIVSVVGEVCGGGRHYTVERACSCRWRCRRFISNIEAAAAAAAAAVAAATTS